MTDRKLIATIKVERVADLLDELAAIAKNPGFFHEAGWPIRGKRTCMQCQEEWVVDWKVMDWKVMD